MSRTRTVFESNLGLVVMMVLFIACLFVLAPFFSALLWAIILSYSIWPAYQRLVAALKGRRTLAAIIVTLSLVLCFLLPLGIIVSKVAGNVDSMRATARQWAESGLPEAPAWLRSRSMIGQRLADYWEHLRTKAHEVVRDPQRSVERVTRGVLLATVAIGHGLVQLGLSIFITFFLLRDGAEAGKRLGQLVSRIGGERGTQLLLAAGGTVRGVVYGILGTAVLQALLAGLGFAVAGVPGVAVLVLLTLFLSVVPLGPPLVFIPAVIWLVSHGDTGWAVFLAFWGLAVSSVDNFVKPWLISQGSDMPFVLIFLGVVGGALGFGFIGVFLGPTLLSVTYRVIQEWGSGRAEPEAARAPS